MLALRYTSLVALAIWVGGLLGLGGVAAPAIFDTISSRQIAEGRVLAGAIFGEVLRRFHLVMYGCGAVVFLSLGTRAVLGPRPRRFAIRTALAVTMLGFAVYSGLVLTPRIARLQQEVGVAASSLPESDPRRAAFASLHQQSTALLGLQIFGGLALMLFELRE